MTILKTGRVSRRTFVATSAAAAALLPLGAARAHSSVKFTRPNVASPQGQEMLKSMAVGIQAMLALPASDPRNWFRNAFTHTLDCPHSNFWFHVWHGGYLGWMERTLRTMSGNSDFAIPYWDWTQSPRIPDQMFDGALSPGSAVFDPYLSSFDTFRKLLGPGLESFWSGLTPGQTAQLDTRGVRSLDALWDQVKNNPMFSKSADARSLARRNPDLDARTTASCSPEIVASALAATDFRAFCGGSAPSHNIHSEGYGILEGTAHNGIHNSVGGVGRLPRPQWGLMADCLAPIDPIFFLHHANLDRLWKVWVRKQDAQGLPSLPSGGELERWQNEEFLFFVNPKGEPVGSSTAGRYASADAFDYDYESGWGEEFARGGSGDSGVTPVFSLGGGGSTGASHGGSGPVGGHPASSHSSGGGVGVGIALPSLFGSHDKNATAAASPRFEGKVDGLSATLDIPADVLAAVASGKDGHSLVAGIALPSPASADAPRSYDVLINAPASLISAGAEHPSYAGTIAFFGYMPAMAMPMDATFRIPLGRALKSLAANNLLGTGPLSVRIVTQSGGAVQLKALSAEIW